MMNQTPETRSESRVQTDEYMGTVFRPSPGKRVGGLFQLLIVCLSIASVSFLIVTRVEGIVLLPGWVALLFVLRQGGKSWGRSRTSYSFEPRGLEVRTRSRSFFVPWLDIRSFQETSGPLTGRRFRLGSTLKEPTCVDTTWLESREQRRLSDRLRFRLRPLFFRRVDWILSDGAMFWTRRGVQVRAITEGVLTIAIGGFLARFMGPLWIAPLVSLRITALIRRATTRFRIKERGLCFGDFYLHESMAPMTIQGIQYRSRTRLFGPSDRWLDVRTTNKHCRIPAGTFEFEALCAAVEGLYRDTPRTEGLYFPDEDLPPSLPSK